jgi:alpha-tubulin suppressor-like RCC1 family protein
MRGAPHSRPNSLGAALIAGLTGCGLFVGVDWDRVQVPPNGVIGYQPDGAPIYGPEGGTDNPNPSGSCPPPQVDCLSGCCAPNADPGTPAHIAAGQSNTCAVTTTGQVRCWGANGTGQLGIGVDNATTLASNRPLTVHRIPRGASAVAVGSGHTCGIVDGSLACWGSNGAGQLGIASTAEERLPVLVTTEDKPSVIAAGENATCAVLGSGAWCWGSNNTYQLAYEDPEKPTTTPRAIAALASGVSAVAIARHHACAIKSGAVLCWGLNDATDLGSQVTTTPTPTATGVTSGATALALGIEHTCAIVNGGAQCWGSNFLGALGTDQVQTATPTPVTPTGLDTGVRSICAGFEFTCAVVSGGVDCFGTNNAGQLGIDKAYPFKRVPTPVDGLASGVKEVACGYMHACALKDDGTIVCWGKNDQGQLGTSTNDDSSRAVTVSWP